MLAAISAWWRRRLREPIPEQLWQRIIESLPFLQRFTAEELRRLHELAERFLRQKSIVGAGGLDITDEIRAAIAVQACVPILHLGLGWYRGWYSVIVYPDDFLAPFEYTDEDGVVHTGRRALSGEAWPDGPVILSWRSSRSTSHCDDRSNLVIHEFVHKLDLCNGDANGLPPLHTGMSPQRWLEAMSAAFEDFRARVVQGEELAFDEYAAEDPGEFFAVISECFFLDPHAVRRHYPAVFDQLRAFFVPQDDA